MVKKKASKVVKKKTLRFYRLAWEILAHKFIYYEGSKHKLKSVTDTVYDEIEEEYKALGEELDLETTATNMVGFDTSKASCQMVMQHMIATKGKIPGTQQAIKEEMKEVRKKINVFSEVLEEVLEEVGVKESIAKKIRIRVKKRMKP